MVNKMNLEAFIKDVLLENHSSDFNGIEGDVFQDLLVKHGLCVPRPITEEECEETWAQEWDYEPGDTINAYVDEVKEFMWGKPK